MFPEAVAVSCGKASEVMDAVRIGDVDDFERSAIRLLKFATDRVEAQCFQMVAGALVEYGAEGIFQFPTAHVQTSAEIRHA